MDKISVIIPTTGRPALLSCLKSLDKQSLLPSEILIIDNSKDRKAKKIVNIYLEKSKFRSAKYIHEKKIGACYARNRGIAEAKSNTLCFIDDDCVADRDWIKELNYYYLINKKMAIIRGENINGDFKNIYACCEYFDEQMFFKKDFYIKKNKIISFWLDSKNFIISKKLINKNKLIFKQYRIAEDLDFSLQAISKNISILYYQKAIVAHHGRTDFFHHIKREINKGMDANKISKYWNRSNNKNYIKTMFNKQVIWKRWKSEKQLKEEIKNELFLYKSIFFRLNFNLLVVINKLVNNLFFRTKYLIDK